MEAFALYLLKSVIWLSGFALIFILFLRNERFFFLNRIYLMAGILTSFFFPLISIHYTVVLPVVKSFTAESTIVNEIQNAGSGFIPNIKLMLSVFYVTGVLFVLTLIIKQGRSVLRAIRKSEIICFRPVKLIKTPDYASAFSFFSYVFVNPSVTDVETKEIMIHEMVHIRQKHWFDLLLVELLCMMQWFNPLVWIYVRFIRQNHEYLADEVALQQTSDPAVYRAVLLNQIVGAPVVSLTNSFNYSLNKKRFNMMKNIISSPYRKMKILLILPVFAIVLYAFAKPDYKYNYVDNNPGIITEGTAVQQKSVKGTVVQQDGKPLDGAIITLRGTTVGTITDVKGGFKFNDVPEDGLLVISFVGYQSKVVKPVFTSDMTIKMTRDTIKYFSSPIGTPPPPPPPPPVDAAGAVSPVPPADANINNNVPPSLYLVDGIEMNRAEVDKIDPEAIESVKVFKDVYAINKYGEKGKNGVIEITMKKNVQGTNSNKSFGTSTLLQNTPPPPPPPPPSEVKISSLDGKTPLFVIDGVIKDKDFKINTIDPNSIESISVLKDESAVALYGKAGEDGVILITTKKNAVAPLSEIPKAKANDATTAETQKDAFVAVEEMPKFQGGSIVDMGAWIAQNIKYPAEAVKAKATGVVYVNFVVSSTGKVKNVAVNKPVFPSLDAEAIRVISSMPDWKPAKQGGKPVDVQFKVPVYFNLK